MDEMPLACESSHGFPQLSLTGMAVLEQAASGALFLNSSRVTVYNSLFDRNRGEYTLHDYSSRHKMTGNWRFRCVQP